MNEARMMTLQHKVATVGLNDDEADELGRLYAEAAGRPYSNAADERKAGRARDREDLRRRRLAARSRLRARSRRLEGGMMSMPVEDMEEDDAEPLGWRRSKRRAA